jgi:hypothetical protein
MPVNFKNARINWQTEQKLQNPEMSYSFEQNLKER